MAANNESISKLLPIAIMAHNEEKVIRRAVESVLSQKTPVGYLVKVVVVANGCSDRTEEIVKLLAEHNPSRVELVSIKEKGKTKAINKAIKYFEQISNTDCLIPYVIFLDADCQFVGNEVLLNFIKQFESNPYLCAVGANCIPDVLMNSRKGIVSEMYKAIYRLGESLKYNSISGGCYCIRIDILKKLDFPEFQLAEDMYISSKLNGWFMRDKNIEVAYETPFDLLSEINKRIRQEISTRRYQEYYADLKKRGIKFELFEEPLGSDYRWVGVMDNHIIKSWLNLNDVKTKLYVILYFLIRQYVKIRAYQALKKIRDNVNHDYWKIVR